MSCCYKGNKYNIPVCIWIHETHPKNPPRCFVCPSSTMVINAKSSNVDASGCVLLHCLSNWKIVRSFCSYNMFFYFCNSFLCLTLNLNACFSGVVQLVNSSGGNDCRLSAWNSPFCHLPNHNHLTPWTSPTESCYIIWQVSDCSESGTVVKETLTRACFFVSCLWRSWPHVGNTSVQNSSAAEHETTTSSMTQHASNSKHWIFL